MRRRRGGAVARQVLLAAAALVFAFPFYFMVVGAFQESPTNTPDRLVPTSGWTTQNFAQIDARIDLAGSLVNSLVFTAGVLLGTVVLGTLAGYAVARLQFPGRRLTWVLMLLVQMVPFAINTTAVFIFAQFFRALPREMFEAARIDGAGELRILRSIALPLVRPALATVVLVTFIGPWNEFLWPFLITKDASLQPLAVSLANYISNVSQTAANPNGAILAGACALAFPVVALFCLFQRYFRTTDLGSAVKG